MQVSHEDLAARTMITRETATLVLNEFKSRGLVRLGRCRIALLDLPGLEKATRGQ